VNGLILPIALGSMLLASRNKKIVGDYKHPTVLLVLGIIVVAISAYSGIKALPSILQLFQ
jgi:Mn2+/Fe2+ NRAMP family transporter